MFSATTKYKTEIQMFPPVLTDLQAEISEFWKVPASSCSHLGMTKSFWLCVVHVCLINVTRGYNADALLKTQHEGLVYRKPHLQILTIVLSPFLSPCRLLIQTGYDVNIKDYDGWTPLHAASHWGKEEACRILVENLCDMDLINKMVRNWNCPESCL